MAGEHQNNNTRVNRKYVETNIVIENHLCQTRLETVENLSSIRTIRTALGTIDD